MTERSGSGAAIKRAVVVVVVLALGAAVALAGIAVGVSWVVRHVRFG